MSVFPFALYASGYHLQSVASSTMLPRCNLKLHVLCSAEPNPIRDFVIAMKAAASLFLFVLSRDVNVSGKHKAPVLSPDSGGVLLTIVLQRGLTPSARSLHLFFYFLRCSIMSSLVPHRLSAPYSPRCSSEFSLVFLLVV